ncbi:MAG: nucleotidyl transferase AbiEii/AbiGii toxin family protein [Dermatophilaceae bacterium]
MSPPTPREPRDPGTVAILQRRLAAAARSRRSTAARLQSLVANVALAQLLPETAVKGGTGLKLRLGDALTRQTPDLDTALRGDQEEFSAALERNLVTGWGGFDGTLVIRDRRPPTGVPRAYVMQPLRVKLRFRRRPFVTVDLEVGPDELGATTEPAEFALPAEVTALFAELGLAAPAPIRVLPLHHQVSQKLHACTEPGNERAHDLVDLQLVREYTDAAHVASTTRRLFAFRRAHTWSSARVTPGDRWSTLYDIAAVGLPVVGTMDEAAEWANHYLDELRTLRPPQ